MEQERSVWQVSWFNRVVKETLQGSPDLQNIWMEGEVFNFTYHSSGHIYFSLKDRESAVSCTFFRGANTKLKFRLSEGMKILVKGGVSVYTPRGSYQFNVVQALPSGAGDLWLKIEELKKRLHSEGIFAQERKRPLPYLPLTVGVATAATGAAIQDIIRVARTRFPDINIILAPCLVQGEGAVSSICAAIEVLQDPELGIDVIIAGRGGGSFEDLMAFNEEPVVRAFAESRIPIVSAVGHEIDHPLSDLAADRYAATPSAAAEMVVPVYSDLLERLEDAGFRLTVALRNRHRGDRDRLMRVLNSRVFQQPGSILNEFRQGYDLNLREFTRSIRERLREGRLRIQEFQILPVLYRGELSRHHKVYDQLSERLENYSPLGTLKRGFAVVRNPKTGEVIRDATAQSPGDSLEVLLHRGNLRVVVESVEERNY